MTGLSPSVVCARGGRYHRAIDQTERLWSTQVIGEQRNHLMRRKRHSIGTRRLASSSTGSATRRRAYLYLMHGTAKLLHAPHLAMFDQLPVISHDGVAGMLEVVGSLLLLVGLFTRPVALILSGEMAVAYFLVHARQGHFFIPALNGGRKRPLLLHLPIFSDGWWRVRDSGRAIFPRASGIPV